MSVELPTRRTSRVMVESITRLGTDNLLVAYSIVEALAGWKRDQVPQGQQTIEVRPDSVVRGSEGPNGSDTFMVGELVYLCEWPEKTFFNIATYVPIIHIGEKGE